MEQIFLKRMNHFYQWMKEKGIPSALITSPANIYYFTNFYSNPHERFMGLFFIENEDPILILPDLDVSEAKKKTRGIIANISGYSDHQGPDFIVQQQIQKPENERFGIEENHLSYKRTEWLKGLLGVNLTSDIEEGLNELRLIKDSLEVKYIKEAAVWADKAIEYGIEVIKPGITELEVVAHIEYRLKQQGIEKMSFDTMVLTGLKTASPHGKPGKNQIENGDLVLFDLGVILNGYCSDISRTVGVGDINEKQKEIYYIVKQAQELAIRSVKLGNEVKEIDIAAREYITSAGYGDYFIHRTGHGLGIDVHEFPSIHETNTQLIKEGMVFTIEPGVYVPDIGGVRIEDDIAVGAEGVTVLTSFTKDLLIIE